MARRRRRSGYRQGAYRYTPKRAAALKRAQAISAKKRRNRRIKTAAAVAGGIVGVGASAYLGHRYGGTAVSSVRSYKPKMAKAANKATMNIPRNLNAEAKKRAQEHRSRAKTRVNVPTVSKEDQAKMSEKVATDRMQPHMGGPDYRIYDKETNEIQTERMTNRRVRQTIRRAKKQTQGKRTRSKFNSGTPKVRSTKITDKEKNAAFNQWVKDYD